MAGDRLRIICGPTAAGKSDLALKLCEIYNAAIVSADSRQIYCKFNIGTAKPTREECARVAHYGIDVADPDERYSAARWAREANEWIESAGEIEKDAVAVVGGTGLYIKALADPLFNAPEQDPSQRSQLERELATMSVDDLRRWCRQLDPARAHLGRTQLLRAIETALLSGSRISELHSRHNDEKEIEAGEGPLYLLVDPGTALASRIEARVGRMLGAGWTDEVRELMGTVSPGAPAWKASGYMVMRSYVEGALDLSSATQRVIIETRQYAKRQRTWFRNQLPATAVTHVNPDDPHALTIAREWWEKAE